MRVEYINPFLESLNETFSTMLGEALPVRTPASSWCNTSTDLDIFSSDSKRTSSADSMARLPIP